MIAPRRNGLGWTLRRTLAEGEREIAQSDPGSGPKAVLLKGSDPIVETLVWNAVNRATNHAESKLHQEQSCCTDFARHTPDHTLQPTFDLETFLASFAEDGGRVEATAPCAQ